MAGTFINRNSNNPLMSAMQQIGFHEAVEAIVITDPRYQREAYSFLRDALESTLKRRKKTRNKETSAHVGAVELLDGFRHHALHEFGPMTLTVLEYWGVKGCEDIGNMVFNLVQAGIFGKTDDDTLEAFRHGFDFHEIFRKPFLPDEDNASTTPAGIAGEES